MHSQHVMADSICGAQVDKCTPAQHLLLSACSISRLLLSLVFWLLYDTHIAFHKWCIPLHSASQPLHCNDCNLLLHRRCILLQTGSVFRLCVNIFRCIMLQWRCFLLVGRCILLLNHWATRLMLKRACVGTQQSDNFPKRFVAICKGPLPINICALS
jgi:hypothetical protein